MNDIIVIVKCFSADHKVVESAPELFVMEESDREW